ncbi:MAG TPA: peptidoglycan editing factor PgeF [Vicinamibacteria bacterium]|nr:peptidoglycan editing factor PgeF [Vicinamibacteria bacterium]
MSRTLRTVSVPALEAIPGLVHGFEQRLGPAGWEDHDETRRRVSAALAGSGHLHLLKQVHGCRVETAPWEGRPEADAAVSDEAGEILGIETADCQPVLLVDPVARRVAAAHAGWRGTAAGVTRAAVAALVARGSRPADILAALGPAIGVCCYEVGPELRESFAAEFFQPGPGVKLHLDVRAANVRQLEQAGIAPAHIYHVADCTRDRPDLYHSYRRDGKGAGRMISFVGFARAGAAARP